MAKTIWVSPEGGGWKVHWEKGGTISSHYYEFAAFYAAKIKVRSLPEGEVCAIRVEKEDGTVQDEWTHGKDPYPPVV